MSYDLAIKVDTVSKCYHIYSNPFDRLKHFIYPRLRLLAGASPKQYHREFWALKNISFEVKKGETIGIIGRNGSGKSTLLQIICGTMHPSNGIVETHGRVAALLELGSGFNPEFTGRENVYMNASIFGLSQDEIDAKFDEIEAFADIGDFIEQPVKSYSSGMLVRLAFAVIANVDADILIIDEALSVGDAYFVQKCMRFLRRFMKTGTILFVSHDISAVLNLCQKAILLDNGCIKGFDKPQKIAERYLEKLYESIQDENPDQITRDMETREGAANSVSDMRHDFINQNNLRNNIELFKFRDDGPSFGKGGARITKVVFLDENDREISWMASGERVKLAVFCASDTTLKSPIVGFGVKDRLGQTIFGDNTYLSYARHSIQIYREEKFKALFSFIMPIMPSGDYTISAAIAEGVQHNHVQHHFIHDALAFRVHSTSICHGLIGVPMDNIKIIKL
jgi:lipopolysaccharide transport system ATP-binding protein